MKSATLFSGFEGAGVGMRAAGFGHAWGIEYDDTIATVARMNGFNTLTLNILEADPDLFEKVDLLHASPPCPNFSVAKANGEETELDIALARKTADFIEVLRPKYFTLENVYQYRNSQSWAIISNRLYTCGYWLDFEHVNFADLGVPQTRQRMIVRAVHNSFVPYLPKKEKWVGWYSAIEDLIPTLQPSQFAPWQLARLPDELRNTFIMGGGGNTNFKDAQPEKGMRYADEPTETITTTDKGGTVPHAFLMDAANAQSNGDRKYRLEDEPTKTVTASDGLGHKAFIVDGINGTAFDKDITARQGDEPVFTVTSNIAKGMSRAWLSQGRVVKMTPRALARFQSFPDWYQLPEKNALACKGIGNACPPLGMEKIYKGLPAP